MLLYRTLKPHGSALSVGRKPTSGTTWSAQQLQAQYPLEYADRAAEITQSLGDCEILDISIGSYHESVAANAHRWTFFLRPNRTDIIDEVYIQLHETFKKNRESCFPKPPYTIHGQGWGYFTIRIAMI